MYITKPSIDLYIWGLQIAFWHGKWRSWVGFRILCFSFEIGWYNPNYAKEALE